MNTYLQIGIAVVAGIVIGVLYALFIVWIFPAGKQWVWPKRIATWLHLASGGGVRPPRQLNTLGRMPIKEPIITIEVGRGYRFVVMPHNSDPDTIIIHGAIEAALLALWRENDDWYRLTEPENSK
jgi:hypothetical protein